MTTAFEPRPHVDDPRPTPEPHGPGTPGSLRPGERGSLLIVSDHKDPEEAMRHAMAWVSAFEDDCGLVLDRDETALYAVGTAGPLAEALEAAPAHDDDPGVSVYVDAVLCGGRWQLRHRDPRSWADLYRETLRGADPDAVCTVWDVYPLPAP